MSRRLDGQVVVVTGGNGGIGRSVARYLRSAGARVAILDLDVRTETDDEPTQLIRVTADVTDGASIFDAFALVESRLGRITGLVNCAGIAARGRVDATELDLWSRVIEINVLGPRNTCAVFVDIVRRRAPDQSVLCSIVNVASTAGTFVDHEAAAYNASKGALVALTKALAVDHGREGVRVNSVSPGWVDTPMSQGFLSNEGATEVAGTEAFAPPTDPRAIGRMGRPDEVAAVVGFLLSPHSTFMTGSDVIADAGWSIGR